MFISGIALFLLGIFLTMFFKGVEFTSLLNPSAIVMQVAAVLAVLTSSRGYRTFWTGLKAAVRKDAFISDDDRGKSASLFRLLAKTSVMAAFILSLVCAMTMPGLIDDVERLQHAVYNLFVSLFYGIVLAVMFEFAVMALKKRQGENRIERLNEKTS